MNGTCNYKLYFGPAPWNMGSSQKVEYLISITVNFKGFYTKLCVFSQMKDTKHTTQDFHSVAWVMPHGWDFGRCCAQMV